MPAPTGCKGLSDAVLQHRVKGEMFRLSGRAYSATAFQIHLKSSWNSQMKCSCDVVWIILQTEVCGEKPAQRNGNVSLLNLVLNQSASEQGQLWSSKSAFSAVKLPNTFNNNWRLENKTCVHVPVVLMYNVKCLSISHYSIVIKPNPAYVSLCQITTQHCY